MAGRDPGSAVLAFTAPIQRAISCFVSGKVTGDRHDGAGDGILTLNRNEPTRFTGAEARLDVELLMNYRVYETAAADVGPWKVSTTGWIYHVFDHRGDPLVQYHWHPSHNVAFPHLHHGDGGRHYPTGRVLVEDLLVALTEFGVEPRDVDEWNAVQLENRQKFERSASWGHHPPPLSP